MRVELIWRLCFVCIIFSPLSMSGWSGCGKWASRAEWMWRMSEWRRENKTYSEKYEWTSSLLLSEVSISVLCPHIVVFMFKNYIPHRQTDRQTHTHTHTHTHTSMRTYTHNIYMYITRKIVPITRRASSFLVVFGCMLRGWRFIERRRRGRLNNIHINLPKVITFFTDYKYTA